MRRYLLLRYNERKLKMPNNPDDFQFEAEHVVIKALCVSKAARKSYLDKIEPDDFSVRTYKRVFDLVRNLEQGGHAVTKDAVNIGLHDATDRMTLSFLFEKKDIPEITPEIYSAFKRSGIRARQIALSKMIGDELAKAGDPSALTDKIRAAVAALEGNDALIEVASPDQVVDATEWVLDQWMKGDRPVVSGLPELDEKLFLSQFIGYWVVAANSGAGKSALMANIGKHNAAQGIPGMICSLEMSKELLLIRMAMADPKVRGLELTERNIKDQKKMSDLKYAMEAYRKLPLYIIDGVCDIFRLDHICRSMAIEHGCKFTLFDYIQLGKTKPTDSDVVRVYTVSRYLQGLIKPDLPNGYHGQTVIALSQYSNEATKSRNNFQQNNGPETPAQVQANARRSMPNNSDLAWSGQIKQDADGILHLRTLGNPEDAVVDMEIHCGKQRNYKSGWSVPVRFVKAEQMFQTDLSVRMLAGLSVNAPQEMRKAKF